MCKALVRLVDNVRAEMSQVACYNRLAFICSTLGTITGRKLGKVSSSEKNRIGLGRGRGLEQMFDQEARWNRQRGLLPVAEAHLPLGPSISKADPGKRRCADVGEH